jgi:hypothetical protein
MRKALPYPDIASLVSPAGTSGGKTVTGRSRARLQALQPREGWKKDLVYLFTFPNFPKAEIW